MLRDDEERESMLRGLRVLDLTDDKGFLCGKILGDLGADVIKIEGPGGDAARKTGPFYHDIPDPEKSLYWFFFNAGKRGITLDIETEEGREIFKKLVKTADIVVESFSPGYMDDLGLGYSVLREIHPPMIMTSITPFGQTGPYRDYKTSDIVAFALSGAMMVCGDPDRPPLRLNPYHAYSYAGANAAAGTMVAYYYRQISGQGQHVDLSVQESVAQDNFMYPPVWELEKFLPKRMGSRMLRSGKWHNQVWFPCRDGWAYFFTGGGPTAVRMRRAITKWMEEEGIVGKWKEMEWETFDPNKMDQKELDASDEELARFISKHTKKELEEEGFLKRRTGINAVANLQDVFEHRQLAHRGFWQRVEYPWLSDSIVSVGQFFLSNETESRVRRPAPRIGEHNEEIHGEESVMCEREGVVAKPSGELISKDGLEGMKVLEFSTAMTGPWACKCFSDFGAEVIKVESTTHPDSLRLSPPFKDGKSHPDRSATFAFWNTSKQSITLDLAKPGGMEMVKRLVSWADVVIQNLGPGVIKRLGLGYEELQKIKSDIIMINVSIYGQDGPYGKIATWGGSTQCSSGHAHLTGWSDRSPANPGVHATGDVITPVYAIIATLAALEYRRRTGKGQNIDLCQLDVLVHTLGPAILDYVVNDRIQGSPGNRDPDASPHGAFRCKGDDAWCAIAVSTEEEWEALCRAIGSPDWARDPKFKDLPSRKENEDELDRLIEQWTINLTPHEVMHRLQRAGVPAGAVLTLAEAMDQDPQLKHREHFVPIEHTGAGRVSTFGWPFKLSKTPPQYRSAPSQGEHNYYICTQILGMQDNEFIRFVQEGVLE